MTYRPNPCQESQPLTREAAGRPQDCDCLSSSVRWAQRTKPTLGVNIGLQRHTQSSVSCSPALVDALSSWNHSESPKESKVCSIDHFYRSPANSWRLLCEYITTTCEYWLPRQSLSDPTGFTAPGDAQSRWNQPERPRRSILAA